MLPPYVLLLPILGSALGGGTPVVEGVQATRHTVFVNFDGATVQWSTVDDPVEGLSTCTPNFTPEPVDYEPATFEKDAAGTKAEIMARARRVFEPYGVRLVDQRPPPELPYAEIVVTQSQIGETEFSTLFDCPQEQCFQEPSRTYGFARNAPNSIYTARYVALSVAGTFGIQRTDAHEGILGANAYVEESNFWIPLGCDAVVFSRGCDTDVAECPPGWQNADMELRALVGPNSEDTVSPVVSLSAPADQASAVVGEPVSISAAVSDNFGGFGWKLVIPEVGFEQPAFAGEKTWELTFPEPGRYTVRVEAIDHDRNVGFDEVTVVVEDAAPSSSGDSGTGPFPPSDTDAESGTPAGSSGEAPTMADDTDGGSETDDSSPPPAGGLAPDDASTGCSVDFGEHGWLPLALLLLPALRRRRVRG